MTVIHAMLMTAGCKIIPSSTWLFCYSIIEFFEGIYTMNVPFALELLKEKDNGSSCLLNLLVGPIKLFQVWIFYSRTADK
jgi:hypothetical protein